MTHPLWPIESGYDEAGPMRPERMFICRLCGAVVTWPSQVLHTAWHRNLRDEIRLQANSDDGHRDDAERAACGCAR